MKKLLIALILSLFPGIGWGQAYSGLPSPSVIYTGLNTWQVGTTYAQYAVVIRNGLVYQSLNGGNTGNDPTTSSSNWSGIVSGGAATPATTSLLKGNGSANGVIAATAGTDYVAPNGSITGNAGTASALGSTPTLCSTGSAPTGILANGNATGCAAFPAAPFAVGNGVVYNTSTTASRNATTSDIQTLIGSGVYDASGAAASAQSTAISTAETFSGNASNITSGTIGSGRIPTLNQSTTGNAATATALAANPTLCSTGSAPTGVLASGNATGCAVVGTVTTFSAGSLSPLFTSSVATATSTPALTFTLSNAAANTVFGNFTGSSTAPTFSATPVFSAATLTNFPTFNQNTTGTAANLSGTPTLPNGTAATTQTPGNNTTSLATTAFVTTAISGAGGGNVSNSGTPTSGQFAIWTGATTLQGVTGTGTGTPVLSNSPTLVTPALGTPSAINLANATGAPTWNQNTTGTSANVTGVVAIANGGTGAATEAANTVFSNSTGSTAAPTWTATPVFSAATLTNFPTLNQNTTGTASNLSGTPALPSGTTATTQLASDSSTKLATTAFAQAMNAADMPSTTSLYKGTGTAGVAAAATAGSDFVAPSTTVNTHALSSNVVISASDLTTGTLPHAQLPTLLTGDIPNNAANTSGTAANLSGTPTLPTGVAGVTQTAGDASTKLSTDAFVATAVTNGEAFSLETSGTNTAAAMVIGTGASLTVSGSGTNNATTLLSATWAAPAAIGTGTPAAGTFSALTDGALTSGQCVQASTGGLLTTTGAACGSGGGSAFSTVTSGTNANALVMGTGGSLTVSGSGTINATSVNGNTFPAAAGFTSGGIAYFSSSSAMASSALMTQYGVIYGGGAGTAPGVTAADTNTAHALFATGTSPAFRAITGTDIPTLNQNTTGTAANLAGCTPSTAGSLCYWNGSAWTLLAGNASGTQYLQQTSSGVPSWTTPTLTPTFSALTGSTNTTAAMVVGSGASLTVSGSGTINATTLGSATFAAPGTIGGTTPGTASFTTLNESAALNANGPVILNNYMVFNPTGTATSGTNYPSNAFNFYGSGWNGSAGVTTGFGLNVAVNVGTNPFTSLVLSYSGSFGNQVIIQPTLLLSGNVYGGESSNTFDWGSGQQFTIDASGNLVAPTITDGALTSGDCVQAGTAGVLSNASGACASAGTGLQQFAATTSAQLAGVLSDETGTGSVVYSTSPTLVTPNLGTPSTLVLTNATGAPTWNQNTTGTAANASAVNTNTFPAAAGFISGGIPYYSSTSAEASSAVLTHYGVMYGGGAGAAPVTTAASTTTTQALFATATAPAFRAISINDWGPSDYAAGAGSVNVITATLTPTPALYTGLTVYILPNLANTTTTPTLNLNTLGAKTITKFGHVALAASDLTTTAIAELIYDGTDYQLQNPQTAVAASVGNFFTHTLTGATPVAVSNSSTVASFDQNNLLMSANVTSFTLPASTAVTDGETIRVVIQQPASGGPYTLPTGTALSPFTAGSGTTLVNSVPGGCPTIGTTQSSTVPSELIVNIQYQLPLTQWTILGCQTANTAQTGVVEFNLDATVSGTIPANAVIAGMKATNAGHFTNLQAVSTVTPTCTTPPTFSVFDGTSNVGTTLTPTTAAQTKGNATNQAETLTFAAGDNIGIYAVSTGTSCTTLNLIITATVAEP
jgi:fibronectin-binding autotransporter adhesin